MTPSQICFFLIITTILFFDQRVQCHKDKVSDNASSEWSAHGLQDSWPFRFLANIGGYLWVIVPLSLLVYLVKRGYLSEGITANKYIRLVVYGNEVDGIPYAQLPITNASTVEMMMSGEEVREKWIKDLLRLVFCFVGLQVSYLTWGLLQEKIMTQEYLIEIAFFSGHHEHVNGSGLISLSHIGLLAITTFFKLILILFFLSQTLILTCTRSAFSTLSFWSSSIEFSPSWWPHPFSCTATVVTLVSTFCTPVNQLSTCTATAHSATFSAHGVSTRHSSMSASQFR